MHIDSFIKFSKTSDLHWYAYWEWIDMREKLIYDNAMLAVAYLKDVGVKESSINVNVDRYYNMPTERFNVEIVFEDESDEAFFVMCCSNRKCS